MVKLDYASCFVCVQKGEDWHDDEDVASDWAVVSRVQKLKPRTVYNLVVPTSIESNTIYIFQEQARQYNRFQRTNNSMPVSSIYTVKIHLDKAFQVWSLLES